MSCGLATPCTRGSVGGLTNEPTPIITSNKFCSIIAGSSNVMSKEYLVKSSAGFHLIVQEELSPPVLLVPHSIASLAYSLPPSTTPQCSYSTPTALGTFQHYDTLHTTRRMILLYPPVPPPSPTPVLRSSTAVMSMLRSSTLYLPVLPYPPV